MSTIVKIGKTRDCRYITVYFIAISEPFPEKLDEKMSNMKTTVYKNGKLYQLGKCFIFVKYYCTSRYQTYLL